MFKFCGALGILILLLVSTQLEAQGESNLQDNQGLSLIQLHKFTIHKDKTKVYLKSVQLTEGETEIEINGKLNQVNFINGRANVEWLLNLDGLNFIKSNSEQKLIHLSQGGNKLTLRLKNIPLWLSVLPPILAIIVALIFKEVLMALFIGIWSGAFIAGGFSLNSIVGLFTSFLKVITTYIVGALADPNHLAIIVFSMLIGGMVALISKNGGMQGVVNGLSQYAKTPRSAQFITWLMGIAIFFDDYTNTLIVGNTMRSVTDKYRISREKLAYIVDSTAAPVTAIAFVTTWIGAELGYIDDGISKIGIELDITSYAIFLSSLKYSFYPILTLVFVLIIIYQKKDFGPMYQAEIRCRSTGEVSETNNQEDLPEIEDLTPVSGAPMNALHAILPVAMVILVTVIGLLVTGFDNLRSGMYETKPLGNFETWSQVWSELSLTQGQNNGFFGKLGSVIGASNSYTALSWASLLGVILALTITVGTRTMKMIDASHWMVAGFKSMLPALIILTLAWALALTTGELHTADFISASLEGNINPIFLPAVIFVLSAFIAFSTGSSWSTMAILYPIAIPTSYAVCTAAGFSPIEGYEIMLAVIATVLAASVLGDHISPISDTTILSSLASDCNHLDHVKTQMPYALLVGLFSLIGMTIAIMLGGGFIICFFMLILCILALFFIVKYIGKEVDLIKEE